MDPIDAYESDVLLALASLRWIKSPRDVTKARDLADWKRQGVDLKAAVEWFRLNPRADWYQGGREIRKGIGYITPIGARGETVKVRTKEEIAADAARAAEEERKPENVKRRAEMEEKLRQMGYPMKEGKG